jgi:hypothetical protein
LLHSPKRRFPARLREEGEASSLLDPNARCNSKDDILRGRTETYATLFARVVADIDVDSDEEISIPELEDYFIHSKANPRDAATFERLVLYPLQTISDSTWNKRAFEAAESRRLEHEAKAAAIRNSRKFLGAKQALRAEAAAIDATSASDAGLVEAMRQAGAKKLRAKRDQRGAMQHLAATEKKAWRDRKQEREYWAAKAKDRSELDQAMDEMRGEGLKQGQGAVPSGGAPPKPLRLLRDRGQTSKRIGAGP